MQGIHGGDIYRNQVDIDFSVNINPLGIPKEVEAALKEAVEECCHYPDITARALKQAVCVMLDVPQEYLLFGNGASELFMAIVHAIRPQRIVIPVPSFYGYEHAAAAVSSEVVYYEMHDNNDFELGEDFLKVLVEKKDLILLANPNNPTGKTMSQEYLRRLLLYCKEKEIYVVLDECFIEFCDKGLSLITELEQFDNLIIVRAFTKIFAIPGVRLGYLVCSNQLLTDQINRQLPEWNLSVFAQKAGIACTSQKDYLEKTVDLVKQERQFLTNNLEQLGIRVIPGQADFILLYSEAPLYELLLEKGILIRDCTNFRGLSSGFYRIAVKNRKENEILIHTLKNVLQKGKQ